MFVVNRKLSGRDRSCVLICQSVREGKKVIQKTLKYYGVAHTEEQRTILIDQARKEIARLKNAKIKANKSACSGEIPIDTCDGALLGHMVERFRVKEGFHTIFGPVFDELGLTPLFSKIRYNPDFRDF